MKFCSHCGAQLNGTDSFCRSCGAPISNQNFNNNQYQQPVVTQPKSKVVAGVLGIILGAFGVHNFYLGYNGKAIAQLLITLLSCGILGAISSIWGLIEGILILSGSISVDAKGNPLGE